MLKRLLRQARNRRPPKPSAAFDEVTEQDIYYCYRLFLNLVDRARGRVLAFEPNADNCELLKISIAENSFDNITLYPYAAAEQEQMFVMGVQGSNGRLISGESQAADGQPAPSEAERVEDEIRLLVKAMVVDDVLGDVDRIDHAIILQPAAYSDR